MIPVREGKDYLVVIASFIRAVGVVNNNGATETFRVLAIIVGMVPISPRLFKLQDARIRITKY